MAATNTAANAQHVRRDLAMIAVQGPNARARTWAAIPGTEGASAALKVFQTQFGDIFIAARATPGERRLRADLPENQGGRHLGCPRCRRRQTLRSRRPRYARLEAGMALYGNDMDEGVSPLDAGLAWTVDFRTKAGILSARPLWSLAAPAGRPLA